MNEVDLIFGASVWTKSATSDSQEKAEVVPGRLRLSSVPHAAAHAALEPETGEVLLPALSHEPQTRLQHRCAQISYPQKSLFLRLLEEVSTLSHRIKNKSGQMDSTFKCG